MILRVVAAAQVQVEVRCQAIARNVKLRVQNHVIKIVKQNATHRVGLHVKA